MNLGNTHRQLFAQFVIAAGICGAAYYFLVAPTRTHVLQVRSKVNTLLTQTGHAGANDQVDAAQLEKIRHEITSRAALIDEGSGPARNEAMMFSRVSDIATRHNIRVDQLQPATTRTKPGATTAGAVAPVAPVGPPGTPAPAPGQPPAAARPASSDAAVGYLITAHGTYPNVVAFMDDLSRNLGFAIVTGFQLSLVGPTTPDQVRIQINTEHFAFDTGTLTVSAPTEAKP